MSIGVPGLGMAKAALELFMEKLPSRRAANLGVDYLTDAATTHHQAAQASLKIETASYAFLQSGRAAGCLRRKRRIYG